MKIDILAASRMIAAREKSAKKRRKKSAKKPARKAIKASVKKPAKKPARKAIKASVKKPAKKPARKAIKASVKKPAKKSTKKAIKASVKKPARKPSTDYRKQAHFYTAIKSALEYLSNRAIKAGYTAAIIGPVINADGSIDGEVRIIRRGSLDDMILDRVEKWTRVPRGCWISTGLRYEPTDNLMRYTQDPAKGDYKMKQGMVTIGTHAQRANQKAASFFALRAPTGLDANMQHATKRKATEIYVRIYYTPADTKPAISGKSIRKLKG